MRVISGEFRGRPLKTPKGSDTRPTTDRVKESLMSSLVSVMGDFEGISVLDAFAGSGGLGIEAVSRGAALCQFFDRDRTAVATVQANLDMLKIPRTKAQVRQGDVFKSRIMAPKPFDLVFLDPPYAVEAAQVVDFVVALSSAGQLAPRAVIVYEHDSAKPLDAVLQECMPAHIGYRVVKSKKQGACALDIIEVHSCSKKG